MDTQRLVFLTLVFMGSGAGGMCRFALSETVIRRVGERFPWGTLVVNVSGALLIGVLAILPWLQATPGAWAVWIYGFLGGYTTVSTFALQTLGLLQSGRPRAALLNGLGSWSLCLLAVLMGSWLGRWMGGSL